MHGAVVIDGDAVGVVAGDKSIGATFREIVKFVGMGTCFGPRQNDLLFPSLAVVVRDDVDQFGGV